MKEKKKFKIFRGSIEEKKSHLILYPFAKLLPSPNNFLSDGLLLCIKEKNQ